MKPLPELDGFSESRTSIFPLSPLSTSDKSLSPLILVSSNRDSQTAAGMEMDLCICISEAANAPLSAHRNTYAAPRAATGLCHVIGVGRMMRGRRSDEETRPPKAAAGCSLDPSSFSAVNHLKKPSTRRNTTCVANISCSSGWTFVLLVSPKHCVPFLG